MRGAAVLLRAAASQTPSLCAAAAAGTASSRAHAHEVHHGYPYSDKDIRAIHRIPTRTGGSSSSSSSTRSSASRPPTTATPTGTEHYHDRTWWVQEGGAGAGVGTGRPMTRRRRDPDIRAAADAAGVEESEAGGAVATRGSALFSSSSAAPPSPSPVGDGIPRVTADPITPSAHRPAPHWVRGLRKLVRDGRTRDRAGRGIEGRVVVCSIVLGPPLGLPTADTLTGGGVDARRASREWRQASLVAAAPAAAAAVQGAVIMGDLGRVVAGGGGGDAAACGCEVHDAGGMIIRGVNHRYHKQTTADVFHKKMLHGCAEHNAVAAVAAQGYDLNRIRHIAVYSEAAERVHPTEPLPCESCARLLHSLAATRTVPEPIALHLVAPDAGLPLHALEARAPTDAYRARITHEGFTLYSWGLGV